MIYSNLNHIMKDNELSVNELSKLTGLSRTTLTKVVKSELVPNETRIATLEKIALALKLPLDMVFPYRYTTTCLSTVVLKENSYDESYEQNGSIVTLQTLLSRIKLNEIDKIIDILTSTRHYENSNFIVESNIALKGDLDLISSMVNDDFSNDINTSSYFSTFLSNLNDYQSKQFKADINESLLKNKIVPAGSNIEPAPTEPVNLISLSLGNQLINLTTPYKIIDFSNESLNSTVGKELRYSIGNIQ